MSQMPSEEMGDAFLRLLLYRAVRNGAYRVLGLFRPGYRNALPLLKLLDRYSDTATMNVGLMSDPRFEVNIRSMEVEIRRLRQGGAVRPFELPHDVPPEAREAIASALAAGRSR